MIRTTCVPSLYKGGFHAQIGGSHLPDCWLCETRIFTERLICLFISLFYLFWAVFSCGVDFTLKIFRRLTIAMPVAAPTPRTTNGVSGQLL